MSHSGSGRLYGETAGCLLCAIRSLSICGALDEGELRELARLSQRVRFGSKMPLFAEGDHSDAVYNVSEGTVRLYKLLRDGRRQIIGFALPGDFIGVVPGVRCGLSADAIGSVMACWLLKESFLRFIECKPRMMPRIGRSAQPASCSPSSRPCEAMP